MMKRLLSDLESISQPSYLPNTFSPYFSIMFTIIAGTFLLYTLQILIIHNDAHAAIHTHSKNKNLVQNPCIMYEREYPEQYIAACTPTKFMMIEKMIIQTATYVLQSPIR